MTMRGLCCLLMVILIFPCVFTGLSFTPISDGNVPVGSYPMVLSEDITGSDEMGSTHTLLIWEVFPTSDLEFVSIRNTSPATIDLNGTSITDGEGEVKFRHQFPLDPECSIILCHSVDGVNGLGLPDKQISIENESLETIGNFRLADSGDQIILERYGEVIYSVIYGEMETSIPSWEGLPCGKPGRGDSIVRKGILDTDTSSDWVTSVPGRSSLERLISWGSVEPMSTPENAREMIVREIRYSTRSIHLSFYRIGDPIVLSEICARARDGVEVVLLLEGQPVGGLDEGDRSSIGSLLNSGVEVRLLNSFDGYKRYRYLHCKLGIFDSRRALIISENLLESSLDRNRGWGVIVQSREIADHLDSMFVSDSDPSRMDVICATMDDFPHCLEPLIQESMDILPSEMSVECWISTVISPDNSHPMILDMLKGANERILVEQLYFELGMGNDISLELIEAARRGVDVRVLLDSSFFSQSGSSNGEIETSMNELAFTEGISLEFRSVSKYQEFTILHNKGVIVDDTVLISSINWCESALFENREVGVVIESPTLADHFSKIFWMDWNPDPFPPSPVIEVQGLENGGNTICLNGKNSSDNAGIARFSWEVDGKPLEDSNHSIMLISLGSGYHIIELTVTDIYGNLENVTEVIHVDSVDIKGDWILLPLLSLPLMIFGILKRIKSRKGHLRNRVGKTVQGKRSSGSFQHSRRDPK